MPQCVILRGIPGSGKSTEAKKFEGFWHINTDRFFIVEDQYVFDPRRIAEAHNWAYGEFLMALSENKDVVVDNTFIHKWEYLNYVLAAKICGYDVRIVEIMPTTMHEFQACFSRNTHSVPPEIVGKMAIEFEWDENAESYSLKGIPE